MLKIHYRLHSWQAYSACRKGVENVGRFSINKQVKLSDDFNNVTCKNCLNYIKKSCS